MVHPIRSLLPSVHFSLPLTSPLRSLLNPFHFSTPLQEVKPEDPNKLAAKRDMLFYRSHVGVFFPCGDPPVLHPPICLPTYVRTYIRTCIYTYRFIYFFFSPPEGHPKQGVHRARDEPQRRRQRKRAVQPLWKSWPNFEDVPGQAQVGGSQRGSEAEAGVDMHTHMLLRIRICTRICMLIHLANFAFFFSPGKRKTRRDSPSSLIPIGKKRRGPSRS